MLLIARRLFIHWMSVPAYPRVDPAYSSGCWATPDDTKSANDGLADRCLSTWRTNNGAGLAEKWTTLDFDAAMPPSSSIRQTPIRGIDPDNGSGRIVGRRAI